MTKYRIIERQKNTGEWQTHGIAYIKDGRCHFLHQDNKTGTVRVSKLTELEDEDLLKEGNTNFRWGEIKEWNEPPSFDPESVLQKMQKTTPSIPPKFFWQNAEQIPSPYKEIFDKMLTDEEFLRNQPFEKVQPFVNNFHWLYENGLPPYQKLVKLLWRYWTYVIGEQRLLFLNNDEYNVALLLYARVFDIPVDNYPRQKQYLEKHRELYKTLAPPKKVWGARATLSQNILAMMDSPIIHVWIFEREEIPQRIIIVGKGLAKHRHKIFNDALVTALRVQTSALDVFNDGLITINCNSDVEKALNITLPVLGANKPLADAETAGASMRELIRQLEVIAEQTGFVEVHKANITDVEQLDTVLRKQAVKGKTSGKPILWTPAPNFIASEQELFTIQPIFDLSHKDRRPRRLTLQLNPELLNTKSWQKLLEAYQKEIINSILIDADIRLKFYQQKKKSLEEEKKQWDALEKEPKKRKERWGKNVTVNWRFDDEVGLGIWLHPPEIIPTAIYFTKNVPGLIQSYGNWVDKMQNIINSLKESSNRPDAPFLRLVTTRCFDAALRNRQPEASPRINKLYKAWANPMRNLLCFEWRKKLRVSGAKPEDLFTNHITFNLLQVTTTNFNPSEVNKNKKIPMVRLEIRPYTLLDAKRSVALFDPKKAFMIVKDSSDYSDDKFDQSRTKNLKKILEEISNEEILKKSEDNVEKLANLLRENLINNPQQICEEIIDFLKPKRTTAELSEDVKNISKAREKVLSMPFSFTRLLDRAETAMIHHALLTSRASLKEALLGVSTLIEKWQDLQSQNQLQHLELISENELQCRLHLLRAFAECLNTLPPKEIEKELPVIYRSLGPSAKVEIKNALVEADNANKDYVKNWFEYLSQWDSNVAYSKLIRDLPTEEDLTSLEQYSSMSVFDAIEVIKTANKLREITKNLDHVREKRDTALIKLGPVLDQALLAYSANVVYKELNSLLEILTGYQPLFTRGG